METTKQITEKEASRIEEAISACGEAAALAYVMQNAFLDPSGTPEPKLAAAAAAGIGRAVERIGKDLEEVLDLIYKRGNE